MSEKTITVADVSPGPGGDGTEPGAAVSLPVVEILTGRGFITGKSGGGKSVLEGTPVHTANGRKAIEDVEEGERVLSLNKHTYEQEFREVRATIEHTDDRLLRITLEDGTELVGTEDHSFLTADGLEVVPVRGDQVEEGTWMPLARELPSAETVTEIDLAEYLDDANNLVVDGGVIQSGPRTGDRRLTLDFDTGKEIGLYLAEGSFDSHLTVQISNVDEGVREFLDSRGYNVYERTCNKGFRPYARFLESEFGRGSGEKSIPNWLYDTPEPFRAGVVSGYVDGDGTVGENTVAAMSKSASLIDGLKELLRQFGVSTTVREKLTLDEGERRRYRRLTVDAFRLGEFADVVDLSVESKRRELRELRADLDDGDRYNSKDMIPNFGPVLNAAARNAGWTTRESDRRVDGASVHNLTRRQKAGRKTYNRLVEELDIGGRAKAFGRSDVQWKRVVDVEELDAERNVYDLDVELNDNFVADGVFVHNSNTASVVIEKLLEHNFPVLVVDTDGEYYGLKEEFELLHAGADEECDIRVSPEHAEKLAGLALDGNVPIVLDVSGYLDEEVAGEVVTETARHLFAKEKKLKKPFLMLVEECHEFVPESGGLDETGKMLVKIGKRGRKHGLGIVGISQRPANVKKDFITQCDWLVWHRLTWDNDTKVVRRIIDREHADAVEDLDDGEAFLMTDWSESVRRVQFRRKRTFDAGATPGLDDFERPELKSVSGDLVDELREISEERERRESELADLRTELEEREARIRELEDELEQARDLKRMADRFSQALLGRAEAPYRDVGTGTTAGDASTADAGDEATGGDRIDERPPLSDVDPWPDLLADDAGDEATGGDRIDERPPLSDVDPWPDPMADDGTAAEENEENEGEAGDAAAAEASREPTTGDGTDGPTTGDGIEEEATAGTSNGAMADGRTDRDGRGNGDGDGESASGDPADDGEESSGAGDVTFGSASDAGRREAERENLGTRRGTRDALVADLTERIDDLDPITRDMLRHYRAEGPADPVAAHLAAEGDADREMAYSRTRTLRRAGLVTHAGRGEYAYALPALVREEGGERLEDADLADAVASVEASFVRRQRAEEREPDEREADEVEFVAETGEAGPAFRDEDAEFVDEGELVGDEATGPSDDEGGAGGDGREDDAGSAAADDGNEGVLMEETTTPSDGLTDRSEEPRDAEFVE